MVFNSFNETRQTIEFAPQKQQNSELSWVEHYVSLTTSPIPGAEAKSMQARLLLFYTLLKG